MARAFKDEIDTLNEALVIAARDIAEAAESELESEEEREADPDEVDAHRRPPKELRSEEPPQPKKHAPAATRFVVDPSGAYRLRQEGGTFLSKGCRFRTMPRVWLPRGVLFFYYVAAKACGGAPREPCPDGRRKCFDSQWSSPTLNQKSIMKYLLG